MKEFTIDPYNLDYEGTFETVQLARWCYRFFCVDFLKDSKGGAAAWRSLKDGGDKWPVLKDLADSTEDPKAVKAWIAAVLAPMIRKENQRNYETILDHANADDTGKVRTKKQTALILDVLADECFYWMIVGGRPDEMLNDAANLPPVIQDVLHDRMERQKDSINAFKLAEFTPLWLFIEKEAKKGRGYGRRFQSPETDLDAVTKKNAKADPTGGVMFITKKGKFGLEKNLDSGAYLVGANLNKVYTYLCTELAEHLPLCGTFDKKKKDYILSEDDKNKIRAKRTIQIDVLDIQKAFGQDIKDVYRILRGAYFTLNDGWIETDKGLWHVGDGIYWDGDVDPESDDYQEVFDAMPQWLQQYVTTNKKKVKDPIQGGIFTFTFNQTFAEYIATKYLPMYRKDIFRINSHDFPNAVSLYLYICDQYYLEVKKNHPKTAHILSVESLLKACPDIPTEDEVKARYNYKYDEKRRAPFEREMNALNDGVGNGPFLTWHYCEPRTTVKVNGDDYSYRDWKNLNVWFDLIDYDDEALKADAMRRTAQLEAKKAKQANKKK